MSDHIPDLTKMIGETPRTDLMEQHAPVGLRRNAAFEQASGLCRQLELELNAANDRIKRLEEAGDRTARWCDDEEAVENWHKAKEAKP